MTVLILGEPEDDTVVDVASGLAARNHAVSIVMSSDLRQGSTLSYFIDDFDARFQLALSDGSVLCTETVDLVLNRLMLERAPIGSSAHERYVGEEWQAAVAGWLRTLPCPVLNPPRGTSVTGLAMSEPEWRVAAARVGLPTAPWPDESSVDATMLVVGDDVIAGPGPISDLEHGGLELADGMLALAQAVGVPLVEGHFSLATGGSFVGASVWPNTATYGETVIDALEQTMTRPRVS